MGDEHTEPGVKIKLKVKHLLYFIFILVGVIVVIIAYLLIFVNGSVTSPVGNGWYSIKGASAVFSSTKLTLNFIGIETCQFCAAERFAIFEALSNFGSWSYYGSPLNMSTMPVDNYSSNPEPDALFYHAEEGDWTLNFLNPHLVYTSNYVNFTSVEVSNNAGEPLQSVNSYENDYLSRYDPGGAVPFTIIGGNFFEVGAGESLINSATGRPILFNSSGVGFSPSYILNQFNTPGSVINKGITKEADYISALICKDISNASAVCSNPAISSLEP